MHNTNIFDEQTMDKFINDALDNGPTLGQSKFQIEAFVINDQSGNARKYRQVLLELRARYNTLKYTKIQRTRLDAKLNILNKKLALLSDIDEQIIQQCDIDELYLDIASQDKLIKDAIDECNFLFNILQQMPKVTKEEFEAEERTYWNQRLTTDAHLQLLAHGSIDQGTQKSLVNLGINPIKTLLDLKAINSNAIKSLTAQTEQKIPLELVKNEETK